MKPTNKNKALFLDRDGTINIDFSYVYKKEDCELIPGSKEALAIAKSLWYLLIMITNQSGIWRWYYTIDDCLEFNKELENKLNLKMDATYICPHLESDNCDCRKPKNKHLLDAIKKFDINTKESFFIWDKESDVLCGKSADISSIYVWEWELKWFKKYQNLLEFVQKELWTK